LQRFLVPILLAAALTASDSRITPAMNEFAADSYKQLARGDGNLILSPFNIATALSMALAGARGQTAQEIQAVLHLGDDSAYHAALGSLLAELGQAGNTGVNELLTANGLWVQKGFAIQPAFEKTLTDDYKAPPALVDFMANPEAVRSQINRWTDEHTKGKIQDLFGPGSLNGRTRLVLTSAIYFYGKWEDPFLTSRTAPAPFTLASGATKQTSFMNQTTHFAYAETPSARILEMRYTGTGMAFDVLLPRTADGLLELEKSLTAQNLAGWLGKLSSRNVAVSLPKFRAESEFSLGHALTELGMPTAFTSKADFSGIRADGGLALSEVVHKAFVDVSERGTEAAAATGISVIAAAARIPEETVIFRADHPFLFLIRDTRSGAVLFIGRLTNPK
jgi:serpin B